jgi:RNA polymerase sigma-70 factor (ECF subfamily)
MTDRTVPFAGGLGPVPNAPMVALVQLVADYHEALYRYAYRLSGSAPDAEDLTQQVFLVAQQKLDQVRDADCVRGWLFTVLRNCYLKGRRKGLGLPVCDLDVETIPQAPPAELIDSEELQAAIDTLGDDFKVVVLMFYFEHRSYREIAECLEIPLGTVMSRLARAKAHLRNHLAEPADGDASNGEVRAVPVHAAPVHPISSGDVQQLERESPLAAPAFQQPTAARR